MKSPKRTITRHLFLIELKTGIATLALKSSINRTIGFRCPDTIEALALVGYALVFVLAHLPADVATRHLAADSVIFDILYSTCYTGHTHLNRKRVVHGAHWNDRVHLLTISQLVGHSVQSMHDQAPRPSLAIAKAYHHTTSSLD